MTVSQTRVIMVPLVLIAKLDIHGIVVETTLEIIVTLILMSVDRLLVSTMGRGWTELMIITTHVFKDLLERIVSKI